jgi:hypothetical protein
MNEKIIAETRAQQRQHRNALRQEQEKYEVTLTMEDTSYEEKELINTMGPQKVRHDDNRPLMEPSSTRLNYRRNQQTGQWHMDAM